MWAGLGTWEGAEAEGRARAGEGLGEGYGAGPGTGAGARTGTTLFRSWTRGKRCWKRLGGQEQSQV